MPPNKIIWEKWHDPFSDIDEEYDWENTESEYVDDHEHKNMLAIISPIGIIPYNEYTASDKIFNFWIGHTNFDISKKVVDTIEKCNGVEILDIFTRYRFRIAVGKNFKDSEVIYNINTSISNMLE